MMELPKKVEKWISTKVSRDDDVSVKTHLVIDLSRLTWKDVLEYAIRAIVIKTQDGWRRKGSIPEGTFTIVVEKPGVRTAVDLHVEKVKMFKEMGFTDEVAERLADNPALIRKALAGEL